MHTQRTPEPIRNYTAALIQSAAQVNSIIAEMERFSRKRPHPRAKPTIVILTELIEGVLADNLNRFHPADLKRATALLIAATEAIGEDLYFVDPDAIEGAGIPDLN